MTEPKQKHTCRAEISALNSEEPLIERSNAYCRNSANLTALGVMFSPCIFITISVKYFIWPEEAA